MRTISKLKSNGGNDSRNNEDCVEDLPGANSCRSPNLDMNEPEEFFFLMFEVLSGVVVIAPGTGFVDPVAEVEVCARFELEELDLEPEAFIIGLLDSSVPLEDVEAVGGFML